MESMEKITADCADFRGSETVVSFLSALQTSALIRVIRGISINLEQAILNNAGWLDEWAAFGLVERLQTHGI
jgi:hypothetical protein